jgi:putative phosphoribosyl transferase
MRFDDREHAGRLLAARLEYLRDARPVVLGLTRGGIPVAFEVARRLRAPLDLIVVRKIRAPTAAESPVGAIAEGGVMYLNPTLLRDARLKHEDAAAVARGDVVELARRIRLYRGEVPPPHLKTRTVVVVDDFVATGVTVRAAALAARQRGAARVVLAVPVLAAAIEPELRGEFDEIAVLEVSRPPYPLSAAYLRFEEVSDEAALAYLHRARVEWLGEGGEPAAAP